MPEFPSSPGAGQGAQALILIAEDEPEIAEILTAYFARNGLRTVHAADGRRALELHLSLKPDLVLLDVQMPHVDGWKVLRHFSGSTCMGSPGRSSASGSVGRASTL